MDRNICKKCRCDHCMIAFKGRSRTAAMVHSEIINAHNKWLLPLIGYEPRPIRMPFKMVLGADIVVEKVKHRTRDLY